MATPRGHAVGPCACAMLSIFIAIRLCARRRRRYVRTHLPIDSSTHTFQYLCTVARFKAINLSYKEHDVIVFSFVTYYCWPRLSKRESHLRVESIHNTTMKIV